MSGSPKKFIKKIKELSEQLDPFGVPDTVAYITQSELFLAEKKLRKLGYKQNRMRSVFANYAQPVSFVYSCFKK